jgi:hypothetical protein
LYSFRQIPGFSLETCQPLGVASELVRQYLDGDVAVEVGVLGTVDIAHAAGAELVGDG